MFIEDIKTMNEAEQKEAIKLLSKTIKTGVIKYTHADPTKEYCYTSSAGCIEGLYFPNTQFEYCKEYFDIEAVVKYRNNLGICVSWKDEYKSKFKTLKNEYDFISFDELLYTPNERKLIEALTKEINAYKSDIEILSNIKLLYKKDGGEFSNLLKAINPEPKPNIKISVSWDYDDNLRVWQAYKDKEGYTHTYKSIILYGIKSYTDIIKVVANDIQRKSKYMKELQSELKQVKSICKKAQAFNEYMKQFSYTTKQVLHDIIKGY